VSYTAAESNIADNSRVHLNSRMLLLDSAAEAAIAAAPQLPVGGWVKRTVDLALVLPAAILLLPLFVLIAVLIKLYDGGPVFYRHRRIGMNSKPFLCVKFRTMSLNGDDLLAKHLDTSPTVALEWAQTRKLKVDPRITDVGAVLRRMSIDELPQVINVVRGEMSIVGPRPIVADEITMYGEDAEYYFRARPGLTGAWQVSGRNDVSYSQRVALDRDYVQNWNLWRDVVIMAKTVPAVVSAKGTY
jgi:exopolysaccharide production protein ExoY